MGSEMCIRDSLHRGQIILRKTHGLSYNTIRVVEGAIMPILKNISRTKWHKFAYVSRSNHVQEIASCIDSLFVKFKRDWRDQDSINDRYFDVKFLPTLFIICLKNEYEIDEYVFDTFFELPLQVCKMKKWPV